MLATQPVGETRAAVGQADDQGPPVGRVGGADQTPKYVCPAA